jgi:hypothetical protein
MSETVSAVPTSIRRLEANEDARRLTSLVSAYDELQTVLRCCERLMTMLGDSVRTPDDVGVEALWTLALLSYARAFAPGDGDGGGAALAESDLTAPGGDAADVLRWHRVLLHLRDRQADPVSNPRETYTVGVAQDPSGAANAVAVTSVHAPMVDQAAVRQAGAIAFPLCAVLDERIDPLQKRILAEVRGIAPGQLNRMDLVEVAAEA